MERPSSRDESDHKGAKRGCDGDPREEEASSELREGTAGAP
jgi:hypothetical protein